jgi:hypothetical protein
MVTVYLRTGMVAQSVFLFEDLTDADRDELTPEQILNRIYNLNYPNQEWVRFCIGDAVDNNIRELSDNTFKSPLRTLTRERDYTVWFYNY